MSEEKCALPFKWKVVNEQKRCFTFTKTRFFTVQRSDALSSRGASGDEVDLLVKMLPVHHLVASSNCCDNERMWRSRSTLHTLHFLPFEQPVTFACCWWDFSGLCVRTSCERLGTLSKRHFSLLPLKLSHMFSDLLRETWPFACKCRWRCKQCVSASAKTSKSTTMLTYNALVLSN